MLEDRDRYTAFYTEQLWKLLPEVYRASDSEETLHPGPLRELVGRLGAQVAVVRRSIDRTREDQSIESCDDWLIPYVGQLLATNLVAGLDARAQRLDVAKTIYYRRRKGTVALLEELTVNITNWNARVVEFFRRLGRTRHPFDPALGVDRDSAVIDGLRGALSGTPAGGFADLRHAGAAQKTNTAFDEFFHTADFRRGRAASGWHNIPKLGFFLWRLKSFGHYDSTPVEDAECPDQFTFDPTGREVPLFARDHRDPSAYGDAWVTPDEWMLPGPITEELLEREQTHLYPTSLAVVDVSLTGETTLPLADLSVRPERGRFQTAAPLLPDNARRVRYHHGFSSRIGAGPYERRVASETPLLGPAPESSRVTGGGDFLQTALAALGATGTVPIGDSLTYTAIDDLKGISHVVLQASQEQRPVVRLDGGQWVFEGAVGAQLVLDGLLITGADLVLRGTFDTVTLSCTTLDPGEEVQSDGSLREAVDGRPLVPVTLWVEGSVRELVVRRSICGPIRTRDGGAVERIRVTDSIVQGARTKLPGPLSASDVRDARRLVQRLAAAVDPLSTFLRESFSSPTQAALAAYTPPSAPTASLLTAVLDELNALLSANSIFTVERFSAVPLPRSLRDAATAGPSLAEVEQVNWLLLEAALRVALGPAAIACAGANVELSRSTLMGPLHARRIAASESILHGFAVAEDSQEGCLRFTAYVEGSVLSRPYESVMMGEAAAIFVTARFGQPSYAQLAELADRELRSDGSIREGAQNGSEMGAFSRELYAVKARGLTLKLKEYMPAGLTPVLIYVT